VELQPFIITAEQTQSAPTIPTIFDLIPFPFHMVKFPKLSQDRRRTDHHREIFASAPRSPFPALSERGSIAD
jgi:hypothetical protein